MGQHVTIIIIKITFQLVNIYIGASAETEQFFFVLHAVLTKQFHGIIHGIGALHERNFLLGQFPHAALDIFCRLGTGSKLVSRIDIQPVSHGKFHPAVLSRCLSEDIIYTLQKQHGGRAHIGLVAHIIL